MSFDFSIQFGAEDENLFFLLSLFVMVVHFSKSVPWWTPFRRTHANIKLISSSLFCCWFLFVINLKHIRRKNFGWNTFYSFLSSPAVKSSKYGILIILSEDMYVQCGRRRNEGSFLSRFFSKKTEMSHFILSVCGNLPPNPPETSEAS